MFNGKRTLAADASLLMGAKMLAFGATFLLPLVLVRFLSQGEFGVYKQLFLIVNTAITMLPFGFAMSAYYFLPRVGERGGEVALNIFVVYTTVAALAGGVLFLWPGSLDVIFNDRGLAGYGRPLAAVLFLAVASSFVDLLALARGDIRRAAIFLVVTSIIKTILLSVAAVGFGTVRAIVMASVIHGTLQLVLLFGYVKLAFPASRPRLNLGLLRQQMSYAIPLGLAGWLYWVQMESHHYFVARAFDTATYAIYAIGCVGLPLASVFGESIGSVIIHRISHLHSQNRRTEILAVVNEAVRHLAAFYLPMYALLMVTGRELITVVFTPQFAASWPIFAINLTLLPLAILVFVSDAVIRSYSECRTFLLTLRFVLVPLMLAGLWYVTPRYGPIATISVMVGANAAERIIVAILTARALDISWRDTGVWRGTGGVAVRVFVATAATLLMRAALQGSSTIVILAASVATFVTVYLVLCRFQPLGESSESVEWPVTREPEANRLT